MKWLLVTLGILGLWLWWPKTEPPQPSLEASPSSRIPLDRAWRAKPESEITLGDMETWARRLSDEELWHEIEKSSEEWLAINGAREWNEPPRLSVMLAREFGRRNGEQGIRDILGYLQKLETHKNDDFSSQLESAISCLILNLSYGTLGGWTSEDPGKAISRLLKIQTPLQLDPWENDPNSKEKLPFITISRNLIPGGEFVLMSEFWAYERVMRSAFSKLAKANPEQATDLLLEGSISGLFDVNQIIEAVLPELSGKSKNDLMEFLNEPTTPDTLICFFDPRLWSNDLEAESSTLSIIEITNWKNQGLIEILARARPSIAQKIALRESSLSNSQVWDTLFSYLASNSHKHLNLLPRLSPEDFKSLTTLTLHIDPNHRHGPIDGKEGGWIPDWDAYHETFIEVVTGTDLEPAVKAKYIETIQAGWNRPKE